MIYQQNSNFIFFSFKAQYLDRERLVTTKEEFERMLLQDLEMEKQLKIQEKLMARLQDDEISTSEELSEDNQTSDVVLPEIVYTEITHTQQEADRLAECQGLKAQLDDVRYYVENGSFPAGDHSLKSLELSKENTLLKAKITQAENDNLTALLGIAESYEDSLLLKEENDILKEKLAAAEADNLTALIAIADVYEQVLALQEQLGGAV